MHCGAFMGFSKNWVLGLYWQRQNKIRGLARGEMHYGMDKLSGIDCSNVLMGLMLGTLGSLLSVQYQG